MSRARFYDVSTDPAGRPLTGVTVTVYTTGTTTLLPATIYAAASGAATRANPFVTSTGVVDFWLEDPAVVDVKYTLAGYGTQTQTVEVVEATPPATAVTVTPVGGLSSTTAQAALAELDADLTAHGGATSAVHGIPDTTLLATDAEVATAVGAHDVAPAAHSGTTVLVSDKGAAGGVATLDSTARVPTTQIPWLDAAVGENVWPPAEKGAVFTTKFAAGHGWTATAGTGGVADLNNTEQTAFGFQAAKLTTGTGAGYVEKSSLTVDLSASSLLVWVYVTDITTAFNFYAGDNPLTNYYSWSPSFGETGWQILELWTAGATVTGSPNAAALTHLRLRVEATGKTVWFGGVATRPFTGRYPNGLVTFSFDDSAKEQYVEWRAKLDDYGWPGVACVIADRVGTGPSYLTLTDLREMQDLAGWEIGGHCYALTAHDAGGLGYTALTNDQLEVEFGQLKGWLLANGFRSGVWASPHGNSNDAVWAVGRKYFHTHRSTGGALRNAFQQSAPLVRPERVKALVWSASIGVAGFLTEIDNCAANKTWLVMCFHALAAGASAGDAISRADYATIVDYVNTKGCAVKTFEQVFDECRFEQIVDVNIPANVARDSEVTAAVAAEAALRTAADGAHVTALHPAVAGQLEFLPASTFSVTVGTPNVATTGGGGRFPCYQFDQTAVEQINRSFNIPTGWLTFAVDLYWSNSGAGTGDVRWETSLSQRGSADDLAVGDTGLSVNVTAPLLNILRVSTLTAFTVTVDPAKPVCHIRCTRNGAHAADTLANDAALLGIMLRRLT